MDQPADNEMSVRGRIACLENDIANLRTILTSAKQNLQMSRTKYCVLEKKRAFLDTEKNQMLIKIDCQQNTIADMKRDIVQYNTECLKLKIKLQHMVSAMGEMISPILLEAIAKKAESIKIPLALELEESLPMELRKNMGLELETSTSSSGRTDTSPSSQPSTSRTSD